MIVTSDAPGWALAIFGVSGLLGLFAFRYFWLGWHTLGGESAILMPLLSGLFGISVLLTASRGKVPEQTFGGLILDDTKIVRCTVLGTVAGIAVGWLPGLSTASANGVLASLIGYEKNRRGYILATNAANTANAFIGLAALFALARMRNGVMAAIAELPEQSLSALMVVGVLAAVAAYLITISLSRYARLLNGLDSHLLNRGVIVFIVLLCIILTGPFGLFILVLATAVGLVPHFINQPKVYGMGCIMIPVIFYSFGIAA
jgi:putative membrane protein